jgi:hypothetical protein
MVLMYYAIIVDLVPKEAHHGTFEDRTLSLATTSAAPEAKWCYLSSAPSKGRLAYPGVSRAR